MAVRLSVALLASLAPLFLAACEEQGGDQSSAAEPRADETVAAAQAPAPAPAPAPATSPGDPERGKQIYETRCGACHSINANRIGPKHQNTYGSKAGSVEGYDYSRALAASGVVWNKETLDQWLQNPQAMVPGTKMGFRVSGSQDRADIIAYLETVAAAGETQ